MLSRDDLAPADEALLDMLQAGRVTAPFVAAETGYSLQYVRDRLGRLVEHGNARKVHEGLYELVEDPRGDQQQRRGSGQSPHRTTEDAPRGIEAAMSGGPTGKGMDIAETAEIADRFVGSGDDDAEDEG